MRWRKSGGTVWRHFFLITYGITSGIPGLALLLSALTGAFTVSLEEYSPLSYLAIWAPAIAAFTVIGAAQGRDGIPSQREEE